MYPTRTLDLLTRDSVDARSQSHVLPVPYVSEPRTGAVELNNTCGPCRTQISEEEWLASPYGANQRRRRPLAFVAFIGTNPFS